MLRHSKVADSKTHQLSTYYTYIDSPIGKLLALSDGSKLLGLYTDKNKHKPELQVTGKVSNNLTIFLSLEKQLAKYFSGKLQKFDLPLNLIGTQFQKAVWNQLAKIPYGIVVSYGILANQMGIPRAYRAVGLANSCNPISIIIPCHRVIGADGSLGGYAGGLKCKEFLLKLEQNPLNGFKKY